VPEPFWADEGRAGQGGGRRRPVPGGGIRIHSSRGEVARTWWSGRFLTVLESLGVGGRLARGRTYARAGQIATFEVGPGAVTATVQGSAARPYRVRIGVRAFDKSEWARAAEALAGEARHAAALLAGEVPPAVEELLTGLGLDLFPAHARDVSMDCTCPDVTVPCKHLAAAFYLLADRLDADPFTLLALRGRDRETLLEDLRARRGTAGAGDATALAELLGEFFTGTPVVLPRGPATCPDALLDQVPEFPVDAAGEPLTALLRPLYRALGEQ
jgi:uncharacterized Zn finger protein